VLRALRAGHVFDGTDVRGPGTLLIEDGVIHDLDFTGAEPPQHARVVDFGPREWLLPGLIDAHVHLSWDATEQAVANVAAADDETIQATVRASAAAALSVGVTTVRDLGDRDYVTLALRERMKPTERPEIVASGPPITTIDGHCHFLGGGAEGVDALRAAVRERAERGCDVVKVMASGGNVTPGSSPLKQQYGSSDLHLIVEEARKYGLRTAAHAHAIGAIADVIDADFDSIEHFTFFTADGTALQQELVDKVVRKGTFASLTVGALPGMAPTVPSVLARIAAFEKVAAEVVASGARVVAGTDAGITPAKPHTVFPHALIQLAQLGMPTLGVLRSATTVAADAVGRSGVKGVLRRGADADILVLGSSPIDDISAVTDVRAVYRMGERVL
jgi:imidazolonepropionase-like amidohydrolase